MPSPKWISVVDGSVPGGWDHFWVRLADNDWWFVSDAPPDRGAIQEPRAYVGRLETGEWVAGHLGVDEIQGEATAQAALERASAKAPGEARPWATKAGKHIDAENGSRYAELPRPTVRDWPA
jgi:hypothetical protein